MRFHEMRFHLGTNFVLCLQDTRMKSHSRTKISFRNESWNELIPESLDFRLSIMKTNTVKYMGMEWTRSGMKDIPEICQQALSEAYLLDSQVFPSNSSVQLQEYVSLPVTEHVPPCIHRLGLQGPTEKYTITIEFSTVKPRFNEVPRDWGNLFVIWRVRYI